MARNDANATYLAIGFITVSLAISPEVAFAQAGLRESLERLDRNGNEYIEPEEITPLARPFLERISRNGRVRLDRPTAIADYQEAARIHHAFQNGVVSTSVRPDAEVTVKPFGVDEGQPMIPHFGLAEIKYPYTADDLEKAERILRSYDRDDDGFIDVSEAQRVRWSYRNPFDDDLDKDSRLGRLELAQRFARRRMLAGDVQELIRKRIRVGSEVRRPPTSSSSSRNDWYRTGGPAVGLTFSLLGQFDSNRNGKLEAYEATRVGIPVAKMDTDQDGEVSREELFAALKEMYDDLEDAVDGLPSWFAERDSNKDDQVSLKEFATDWSSEQLEEFGTFDVKSRRPPHARRSAQRNSGHGGHVPKQVGRNSAATSDGHLRNRSPGRLHHRKAHHRLANYAFERRSLRCVSHRPQRREGRTVHRNRWKRK